MTRSEALTRSELIDRQLARSGWNVETSQQVTEEFDIVVGPPDGADNSRMLYEPFNLAIMSYWAKNGKPLAVVEAKRTSKDAALGREQAKQYCYNIQKQLGGELPFCFYTNGHEIYFWDLGERTRPQGRWLSHTRRS